MTNPTPPIQHIQADRQRVIETRFEQIKGRTYDRNQTVEEIFGPLEDWTLEIGRYQLLLLPLTGQWWYLHPLYETWENTGYKAGEITFYLQGGLLEGRALESRVAAPVVAPVAPPAQTPAPPPRPVEAAPVTAQAFSAPDRELENPTMITPRLVSWQLVALSGPHAQERYTLGAQTRLGRVADNEIVLADPLTSRHHAQIQSVEGGYLLSDLDSQNGTYVNGQRIHAAHQLAPGDQIRVGGALFEVAVAAVA